MRRFVFFALVVCFRLMSVAVVKGNEKQPAVVEAKVAVGDPKAKVKVGPENASDPESTEEPGDADLRLFAIESAVQNFRVSNECYQLEVGLTPYSSVRAT